MDIKVKVFQTVPVSAPIWLQTALREVLAVCLFDSPPPIELRPTGRWLGWCSARDMAPDGRVVISGRARFWSQKALVLVYLHEVCHRLIPNGLHDPAFLCMNLCLLLRADLAALGDHVLLVNSASLYDIQDLPSQLADEPDHGLARSIQWSVLTARQLVQDGPDTSAEALAVEVQKRFDQWLSDLDDEPKKRAQQVQQEAQQMARQKAALAGLQEQIFTLRLVVGGLGFLVAAMFLVLK
jgi:hypothetical protein